jgi:hypothetical protein
MKSVVELLSTRNMVRLDQWMKKYVYADGDPEPLVLFAIVLEEACEHRGVLGYEFS